MVTFEFAVRAAVESMSSLGGKSFVDVGVILPRKVNLLHFVKRSLGWPSLVACVDLPRRSFADNQSIFEVIVMLGETSRLLADHKLLILRLISCVQEKVLVRL